MTDQEEVLEKLPSTFGEKKEPLVSFGDLHQVVWGFNGCGMVPRHCSRAAADSIEQTQLSHIIVDSNHALLKGETEPKYCVGCSILVGYLWYCLPIL